MLLTKETPMIINKPEYKYQTSLFLSPNPDRKGEGGLRTKGLFKHSYKLVNGIWYMCDTESKPVKPAEEDIQLKIKEYISKVSSETEIDRQIDSLPLITVITVVYNGAKYLEETIQSVINQTYPNVEYIIIDGGSTDGTIDIIKKYEDKIDYWVSEKDEGIYDAMNKGIYLATGQWLNFMNSGDMFYNRDVIKHIFKDDLDDYEVIYGSTNIDYDDFRTLRKTKPLKEFWKGMPFSHQSTFTQTKLYKIRPFSLSYSYASDFDFFLYLYKQGLKFFYSKSIISKMRAYGKSDLNRIDVISEFESIVRQYNPTLKVKIYYQYVRIDQILRKLLKTVLPKNVVNYIRQKR